MTRASALVFTLLLAAPCASMKMKAAGPEDYEMPNCVKLKYNQLNQRSSKSCYVYHTFTGYHPETGERWNLPKKYEFEDTAFILDGISPTLQWRWAQQHNSWASSFTAETFDGGNHEVNCNKRTSEGYTIPGYLDTCPHGPVWQAEFNYNQTQDHLMMLKNELRYHKKEIGRSRKVMKIVAQESLGEMRGELKDTKDEMAYAKAMMDKVKKNKKK